MNAVELDVGNLNQWLLANPAWWTSADKNGYLLSSPIAAACCLIRTSVLTRPTRIWFRKMSSFRLADGHTGRSPGGAGSNGFSPEDVDENKLADNWGAANVGNGMRIATWAILIRPSIA